MVNFLKEKKNKRGMTLAELLVVIGIIVVLIAIAIPSVFMIRKSLRQTELDGKAEIIYSAVQNRLTGMRSAGLDAFYKPEDMTKSDEAKSVFIIHGIPGDSEDTELDNKIFYTSSVYENAPGSVASAILTEEVVEPELAVNHWVIEYNPESGIVYAVYYSESETDCALSYADDNHVITKEYNDKLRVRSNRLRDGARVGYYGGSNSRVSGSAQIRHTVEIHNDQMLSATIKSSLPVGFNSDSLLFKVTLSDGQGNSYISYYSDILRPDITGSDGYTYKVYSNGSGAGSNEITRIGRLYTLNLTLDSLAADELRFDSLYGSRSGHNSDPYGSRVNEELTAGNILKIEVEVSCPEDKTLTPSAASSNITNSLFADESNELKNEAGTINTAVIKNARHLQNLDSLSGVSADISSAIQTENVEFAGNDPDSFSAVYGNGYFNGTQEGMPIFKPVRNDVLASYKGRITDPETGIAYGALIEGLFVSDNGVNNHGAGLGLFETIDLTGREVTVSDIAFTGAKVISKNNTVSAGALAGSVSGQGRLYVTSVGSYLTFDDYNGKTNNDIWISGKNAGGLIGQSTDGDIYLTQCFAGTVIAGDNASSGIGGLIGNAASGRVGISASYADTYLKGAYTGGLVGTSNAVVAIESSYSAGFETYAKAGAGLVCGKADEISRSYTIISKLNEDEDADYYALAASGNAQKAYYVVSGSGVKGTGEITKGMKASTLLADLDSPVFTLDRQADNTKAYNLMDNQELNTYEYPRINGLIHYCDWEASFRQGALVYFEHYEDDSWGFAGGDISTLKSNASLQVTGDGYAIAFTEKIDTDIKVALSDPETRQSFGQVTFKADTEPEEVTGDDGETYYVYPFEAVVVNRDFASRGYCIKAVIGESEDEAYYFNPYYARTSKRGTPDKTPAADSAVFIRSARQLHALAEYYSDYSEVLADARFIQEKDIDYDKYLWAQYYDPSVAHINAQIPIGAINGANVKPFTASYDGQRHVISNISFTGATSTFIGMFAENDGSIANVVLYSAENQKNYFAKQGSTENQTVYLGALCGYNAGTITNCAVSGYSLNTNGTTVLGYSNSRIYAGGLVGFNAATGKINGSSADMPEMRISSLYGRVLAGGFAGANAGIITDSYAVGYIDVVEARGGAVAIAGFTAENNGSIEGSYCAEALVASGESSSSYGFAPKGGSVNRCYYLSSGSYSYNGKTFAYNADSALSSGTAIKYADLAARSEGDVESHDYGSHAETEQYPFKGYVRGSNGNPVHYGSWPDKLSFGESGLFYWEHEVGGSNEGYHLTFIGIEAKGTKVSAIGGATLCTSHDDGGVIEESGYGYFTTYGDIANAKVKWTDIQPGTFNSEAAAELAKQMPEYSFMPYTVINTDEVISGNKSSGNHMFLERNVTAGSVEIGLSTTDYKYTHTFALAPYFANAMQYEKTVDAQNKPVAVDMAGAAITGLDGRVTDYCAKAGEGEANAFEIRSARQLQLINWNYKARNATTSLHTYVSSTETSANTRYNSFRVAAEYYPYLGSFSNAKTKNPKQMYWIQTHDVDNAGRLFTPIGSLAEASVINENANLVTVQFDGTYDGQSYQIKNIEISSSGQAIGLFSVTMGATLKNIIMYSDNGNVIKANDQGIGWYSIGGLVGFAANGTAANGYGSSVIINCAVSGYTIVDERINHISNAGNYSFGGANIGGLAGVAVMNISNCEAVNDFIIRASYSSSLANRFIRVGGLVGCTKASVSNCYTGGSMISEMGSAANRVSVYFSGVAGGNFIRTAGNMNQVVGPTGDSIVSNCYSYMLLPESNDSAKKIGGRSPIANSPDGGSVGRMTISNCYYYDKNANGADSKSANTTGTATKLTYEEMRDDDFAGKLGGSWSKVTVVDAGGSAIDGKYSFPGNASELYGMNYPFPTILKQTDLTFSTVLSPIYVNVHYGKWAVAGLYWENGRDSMDIFDNLDDCSDKTGYEKGYAYKEFKLHDPENDTQGHLIEKNEDGTYKYITSSVEGIGQIADISYDSEKHIYTVLYKALKDGAVKIEANYQGEKLSKASFNLEITAGLKVFAANDKDGKDIIEKPVIVEKSDKPSKTLYLMAASVPAAAPADGSQTPAAPLQPKDLSKLVKWTVTPDTDNVITFALTDNACRLTRDDHGIIILTVKGEYDYHGVKYQASAFVTVSEPDVVGISSGKKYSEVRIPDAAGDYSSSAVTYGANPPFLAEVQAFLYASLDSGMLSESSIDSLKVIYDGSEFTADPYDEEDFLKLTSDGRDEVFRLKSGQVSADGRYQYLGFEMYVEGNADLPGNVSALLQVVLDGPVGDTIELSLEVNMKAVRTEISYTVSFDANGGEGTMADETFEYSKEKALSLNCFTNGDKTFAGWAVSAEAALAGEVSYQDGEYVSKLTDKDGDNIILYAVWTESESEEESSDGASDETSEEITDEASKEQETE